jgi:hypothetical protein
VYPKIVQLSFNQILFFLLAFLLVILVPYIVVYGPNINLKNLLLQDVYVTRFEHRRLYMAQVLLKEMLLAQKESD